MNKSTAWKASSIRPQARRLAEEAARRAGLSLEEWLDEAIVGLGSGDLSDDGDDEVRARSSTLPGRAWIDETEDYLESAIARIERRLRRGEERMERAFETITGVLERTRESGDRGPPSPSYRQSAAAHERQRAELQAAAARPEKITPTSVERTAPHRRLDERFEEIAQRIEAARLTAHAPNGSSEPNSERRRDDLRAAVSQFAVRRQAPHAGEAHRSSPGPQSASDALGAFADHDVSQSSTAAGRSLAGQTGPAADGDAPDLGPPGNDPSGQLANSSSPQAAPEDLGGVARRPEHFLSERDQRLCAIDLTAMREGIAAMNRSLAELAPRNALVALEGAIRDLTERVALLRHDGERESLLAPLDAMAAELRASLRSHDPQAVVAGLEREISALAGKVDALAEAAISAESFDRIQRHTEEVRDLLAAAATRSAPLERLERQISELADRVERLGASPAPQLESAQMVASLADLRSEIEGSTPLSALMLIERRLEHIAARLDEEISLPAQKGEDSHALEDLAYRIDCVHKSLDARLEPQFDTSALEASLKELSAKLESPVSEPLAALMRDISDKLDAADHKDAEAASDAIEPMLAEILDKLDRLPQPNWTADLSSIERRLQSLDAKLDFGAGLRADGEIAGQIAEEVARRLGKTFARIDEHGLAEQIAHIHDRLETLSGLDGMQGLMRKLCVQLADRAGEPSSNDEDETLSVVVRAGATGSSASVVRGIEALEATESSASAALRRPLKPVPSANEDDSALSQSEADDVLLEPGSGTPQRVRETREPARDITSKTSPSISAHIAAARRAAHSALSEGSGQNSPVAVPAVSRGIERARSLYTNHKRSVLLAAALAIVATAAIRLGVHVPLVQKSELSGRPAKTAAASPGKPTDPALATPSIAQRVDTTPTASIAPEAAKAKADSPNGTDGSQLSATLAAALPTSLRDAVVVGSPTAEYELAQRLFEGRGVPQDQQAAALWFERAAASGSAPAQFRLGMLYNKGVGVQRDATAAKRWYAKAAEAGNARAAHNLAVMYAEPVGGSPDYAAAAKWFRKAAEMGVRDSEFNLAILYARGLGVDQDLRQSWLWFSLAAAQGDADAAKKRDEVAAKMDPAALAAAADELAKFKVAKPDPAANDVASPPNG